MTVRELIDALLDMPLDEEVVVDARSFAGYGEVQAVELLACVGYVAINIDDPILLD